MNIIDSIQNDLIELKRESLELKNLLSEIHHQITSSEEKFYSLKEFSEKLGIHYQTARNLVKDGRIQAVRTEKNRGKLFIPESEVRRALKEVKS